MRFSVQFDPRVSTMPEVRENLLLCLRDIRGGGATIVTGIETPIAYELAKLMMIPIKTMDEVLEQVDGY